MTVQFCGLATQRSPAGPGWSRRCWRSTPAACRQRRAPCRAPAWPPPGLPWRRRWARGPRSGVRAPRSRAGPAPRPRPGTRPPPAPDGTGRTSRSRPRRRSRQSPDVPSKTHLSRGLELGAIEMVIVVPGSAEEDGRPGRHGDDLRAGRRA